MKRLIIIFLYSILTLGSCTNFECPGFDDNSFISDYNLFKNNLDQYNYLTSDSIPFSLSRTTLEKSSFTQTRCSHCQCTPELTSEYYLQNFDIQFSNTLLHGWRSENIQSDGELYLKINEQQYIFNPSESSIIEAEIENSYQRKLIRTSHDSLKLNFRTFYEVTQFELIDSTNSKVNSIWYTKKNGLIGFKIDLMTFEII